MSRLSSLFGSAEQRACSSCSGFCTLHLCTILARDPGGPYEAQRRRSRVATPRYAEAPQNRAISGDLGPRRAISGDLALSRAISGPRRAISGDLGASLARRHTCSKKEGPGWSHGAHVLARCAASLCAIFEALARAGEAAPRAARSSPSTPTPARTAHLQPSWGYSRAHAGPGGLPSPHLRRVRSVLRPLAPVHIACPPPKAGAKARSTAKAGARAKSTAWLVPRLKGSPLSLSSLSTLSTFSLSLP